jgi:hypothetical protein
MSFTSASAPLVLKAIPATKKAFSCALRSNFITLATPLLSYPLF